MTTHATVRPAVMSERQWYNFGVGFYFAAGGVNTVLFPWLVAVVLHLPAAWVGFAQMAANLPLLTIVLLGGAIADRTELRRHLLRMQLLVTIPTLFLAACELLGTLSYSALLTYGVLIGTISALVMPARDAALTRIALRDARDLPRAVAAATGLQYGGQLVGIMIGGIAEHVGLIIMLGIIAALVLIAAAATSQLAPQPAPANPKPFRGAILGEMRDGIAEAFASRRIRTVIIHMLINGFIFMGVFMVGFPILIRDIYAGSSIELAIFNMSFLVGIIGVSFAVAMGKPIQRQGRAIMISLLIGVACLIAMQFAPSFPLLALATLVWGVCGGFSVSLSRAIVQEAAPASHRARIISIFQLAALGGAPVGALLVGFIIQWLGTNNLLFFAAVWLAANWLALFFFSNLWRLERIAPDAAAK